MEEGGGACKREGGAHGCVIWFPQAAQEREDLQKTGDDLDAKIRKAEKEIRYNPTCSEGQCPHHSQRYY